MEILKVKERRLNEELIGYMINSKIFMPIGSESQELKEWLKTNTAEPEFTPEEIEKSRVQSINSYTQSFITKKYPLGKQSSANLGIYGDEYKNEMISFISNCISLSNEAIENNTSFDDYKAMLNE